MPPRFKPLLLDVNSATAPLEQMLASADPVIRMRAVEGLSAMGTPDAIPPLIIALADADPLVQSSAHQALGNIPGEALADAVVAVLGWGDLALAQPLDATLPTLKNELEPPLIARFHSPGALRIEKMTIAYCLGRIGSTRAGALLAAQVWGDDMVLGYYCADALAGIDDQSLLREYIRMTAHPQVYMRTASYRGLARIGGDEARAAITEAAAGRTEPDTSARKIAIRMLAYVGTGETIEFLIGLVRARTGLVETASDALATITGLPRGLQRERWLEWYDEIYVPSRPTPAAQRNMPKQAAKPAAPPPTGFPEDGFPFQP